ncbi:MerR HTH family regulatory protein [Cyclobacterium lianum]|uniref:MerR HTH family regulatory protein n=1 Tax=Cyclobacterium lianum TaxID=388280 RepID=A0A1M7QGW9_9BACT|nr:chaperone modulator CbpM [Cyclobacterium lianum]SHN30224.1 MerR HTH family regulatory protein [Cyclobacterium lianum]
MNNSDKSYIPVDLFCETCGVEISFVRELSDYGLCEVIIVEEKSYILPDQVAELERLSRLHYDMEINLEGLQAIVHLQEKIKALKEEVDMLNRKLNRHQ